MKNIYFFFLGLLLCSCNLFSVYQSYSDDNFVEIENDNQNITEERQWTILIYMCADNNLESSAMDDIYEMEKSILNTSAVTVLFLIDRNPAYNSSYENWSGTRLYKLNTERKENQKNIISTEIDCKELGLGYGKETEIDMSDGNVLATVMSNVYEKYPAEHYGLIMWGHGSGWKNDNTVSINEYKGFAYDETSDSYMTLRQFGSALEKGLKGCQLDFLGFDTCYGGELEVMYEIRNYAKYACGSEGLVSNAGWDYTVFFNDFQSYENKSVENLLKSALYQFKKQYAGSSRASFCVCDLSCIENYFLAFDDVMKRSGDLINNAEVRDDVFSCIYASKNASVEKYSYGKDGYDVYLDCVSLADELSLFFADEELNRLNQKFRKQAENCVIMNWASDRSCGGLGVYFQTLGAGDLLQTSYNGNYVKGKTYNQIDFVADSQGYVPCVKTSGSLLDKIFYFNF